MNEERVAILNLALEKRLDMADAARLLERLAALERGDEVVEACVVEPPCRPPSWMRAGEDALALVQTNRIGSFLTTATQEIVRALNDEDRSTMTPRLATLDVPALGDYSPLTEGKGFSAGGMELKDEGGVLGRHSCNLLMINWTCQHEAELPMIHWLLLPGKIPAAMPEPGATLETEREGLRTVIYVRPETRSVATDFGVFPDCLEVTYVTQNPHPESDEEPGDERLHWLERWTLWLARGVGPVKLEGVHFNGTEFSIRLSDCHTSGGESYFPLDPGNWWRFDTRTPAFHHRELWRTLAPQKDGRVWVSTAARTVSVKGGA